MGDLSSRENYIKAIVKYFSIYEDKLSEESKIRLKKNPLRILDSKDKNDKEICSMAPKISDYLSKSDIKYFECVCENLSKYGIKYSIDNLLVRGLDYYSHTIFELKVSNGQYKDAIGGGGRYDNLVEQIGDAKIPSVGFGGGIERMMLLIDNQKQQEDLIAIVPITENENTYSIKLANELRNKNYNVEIMYNGKFKNKMEKINKINATHLIVIGEDETKTNDLKIKNLSTGKEEKFII